MRNTKLTGFITAIFLLTLSSAWAAKITDNNLKLGDETGSDVTINMGNGQFLWDDSEAALKFSKDGGATSKEIGSGAGGGGGINLLVGENFDFEDGSPPSNWTASGGAFTSEVGSPLFGAQSGNWDASAASQNLDSTSVLVPIGLREADCLARVFYKYDTGANGDYKLQMLDGSANVLAEVDLEVTQLAGSREAFVVASCPASGNMQLRLTSTTDPGALVVDEAHLGSNIKGVQQGSAEFYGSALWVGTTDCVWSRTSNATYATYTVDANCTFPTGGSLRGKASAPSTKIPAIQLDNAPAGEYYVVFGGDITSQTASQVCSFRLTDGVTPAPSIVSSPGVTGLAGLVVGHFSYTDSGNRTIEIQGTGTSAAVQCDVFASLAGLVELEIKVYRYPLESEKALEVDSQGFNIDVSIGGANPDLGTADVTTYTGITDASLDLVINAGSRSAQIACAGTTESSGLVCSAADESVGISFTIPHTGKYEVCSQFSHSSTGGTSTNVVFQLVETPNNAQTISQEGRGKQEVLMDTTDQVSGFNLCGLFEFSSSGKKTVRLFREQDNTGAPTNILVLDRLATLGQRDLHFSVRPWTHNVPSPVLLSGVVSSLSGGVKIVSATLACDVSPVITRQDGAWISSFLFNATGDCTVNIAASTFSGAPSCVVAPQSSTSDRSALIDGSITASAFDIKTITASTGVVVDDSSNVICVGPK